MELLCFGACEFPSPESATKGGMLMSGDRMFLYVYFSEEEADAELHGRRRSLSSPDRTFRRARRAIRLLIIVVAFAFAVMLISAVILNRFPWYSQEWANVLGICVACFACVQWVPQVWTTIHLGHLGSLSLASICMGAPVSIFFSMVEDCMTDDYKNSTHGSLAST